MSGNILAALLGSKKEKDIKAVLPILHRINALEPWAFSLSDSDFPAVTNKFRERLAQGETLDDLLPEPSPLSAKLPGGRSANAPSMCSCWGASRFIRGKSWR